MYTRNAAEDCKPARNLRIGHDTGHDRSIDLGQLDFYLLDTRGELALEQRVDRSMLAVLCRNPVLDQRLSRNTQFLEIILDFGFLSYDRKLVTI